MRKRRKEEENGEERGSLEEERDAGRMKREEKELPA
jgi:hypothetical protein